MNPCWIITLLADEGELCNQAFTKTLDRQLRTWSHINKVAERWWAMDSFAANPTSDLDAFATALEKFLHSPLEREGGQEPRIPVGTGELSIILVGDVRTARTRNFLHCLAKLLRLQELQMLQGRAGFQNTTLNIQAFLYFPLTTPVETWEEVYYFFTQLHTLMSDSVTASKPFNTIFFFQEKNYDDENINGYGALSDEQAKDLMVQSLFHLMIKQSDLPAQLRLDYQTSYAAMGATAVFYDWEAAQRRLAKMLGEDLLAKFSSSHEAPFVNDVKAKEAAAEVFATLGVKALYQRLITGTDRPSLTFDAKIWEGAKDGTGKVISPWAFYSKMLLLVYFKSFLKHLPLRVSEYVRDFLQKTMGQFLEFLRKRRVVVWEGSTSPGDKGLRQTIRDAFGKVLRGDYGNARSLGQVSQVAEEIKNIYDPRKIEAQLAAVAEFNHLDVFAVPQFLRPYYESAAETLETEEEENLYQKLVDAIRSHPMPTALFTESFLIGFLLALIGYRLLSLASPEFIDLSALLSHPYVVRVVLFLIPIGLALSRYHFGVIKYLRKRLYTYLGAVLRHAQTQAKEIVRQEMAELFRQAQDYCMDIKSWVEELSGSLAYPPVASEFYLPTVFQREVFQGFDIPGRMDATAQAAATAFQLEVGNQQKSFEQFEPQDKNIYLSRILNELKDKVPLWERLSEAIPPAQEDDLARKFIDFWSEYAEKIYQDMSKQQLDNFLNSSVISTMKALSHPPINISTGLVKLPVVLEWKYGEKDRLAQFAAATDVVEGITGTSLASLAGFRAIQQMTDISILRNIIRDIQEREKDWTDLASVFTAATTQILIEEQVGLEDLVTQEFIPLDRLNTEVSNVQRRFRISDASMLNRNREVEQVEENVRFEGPELEV